MSMLSELLATDYTRARQMEPEELAGFILVDLRAEKDGEEIIPQNLGNGWRGQYGPDMADILMEGWAWLVREALIAPKVGNYISGGVYRVTRRGKQVKAPADLTAIRQADSLPRQLLHPEIANRVWSSFIRGEHDIAVLQAFRAVEVAVRKACGFPETAYGTDLMRSAIGVNGPLTDQASPPSEREAVAHLFAGAIGFFKNPPSHRHVDIARAETTELIMFASHLLRIVDSRSKPI